jgi:hypothetical protein
LIKNDRSVIPVELKGDKRKRPKALIQLAAGFTYAMQNIVGAWVPYGLFVVYDLGVYHVERIDSLRCPVLFRGETEISDKVEKSDIIYLPETPITN